MNPTVKQKWLQALRSGEFEQAHGELKQRRETSKGKPESYTYKFCCLGVLCELHRQMHEGLEWEPPKETPTGERYLDNYEELPQQVAEWAGLNKDVPIEIDDDIIPIYLVNDGMPEAGIRGHSFMEIAEIIEGQL